MALYNRKHYKCIICGEKHYARNYCRSHYDKWLCGYPLVATYCKIENCNSRVRLHFKEQLCCNHYAAYERHKHAIYKKDGGKWGYKNYFMYKRQKKKFCEICNSTKNLHIHHKDKNKRNSNEDNLITVCCKCHYNYFHKPKKKK